MSNHGNNYYNIMLFCLKNPDATYQWLMNDLFAHQIGQNMEVYIDDVIVKTIEGNNHGEDFEDVL